MFFFVFTKLHKNFLSNFLNVMKRVFDVMKRVFTVTKEEYDIIIAEFYVKMKLSTPLSQKSFRMTWTC
jgi:hypothetical protein